MRQMVRLTLLVVSLTCVAASGCAQWAPTRLFDSSRLGQSIKNGQAFDPRAREIEHESPADDSDE